MHSYIYQVSASPIDACDYITEETAYNDSLTDYCSLLDADRRAEEIQRLADCLPKGTVRADGETLVLIDAQPIFDMWMREIEKAFYGMKADPRDPIARYRLERAVTRPLDSLLFFTDDWAECTTKSEQFVEWLGTLEPGTRIHFGAILDYHF